MVIPSAKIWDEPICDGLRDCQDVAEEPTHYATVDAMVRVSVWSLLVMFMVRVSVWWLVVGIGKVFGGRVMVWHSGRW